tara:strand:- start:7249 stop:7500 length:252 start_codon:yes stop_codon:yes gene_type:complete
MLKKNWKSSGKEVHIMERWERISKCLGISPFTASSAPLLMIRSFPVRILLFNRKALCIPRQKNPFHYIAEIHLPIASAIYIFP